MIKQKKIIKNFSNSRKTLKNFLSTMKKKMTKDIDLPLTGKCSCGQVSYELSEAPLFTHACHCVDCQCSTGSAFVIHTLTNGFYV